MEQNKKSGKLLEAKDLQVFLSTPTGEAKAVSSISYNLDYNEIIGIVGELGSDKSQGVYFVMELLQPPSKAIGGSITFEGRDALAFNKKEMASFRGSEVAMIFQDPMACLNPVYTVGNQFIETLRVHDKKISKADVAKRTMEMLGLAGINNAAKWMKRCPYEFSGGMRQRVMIAMGLICYPKLLIADEPTITLDVTIQAQILELVKELRREAHMGIIFIAHNLGVVTEICNEVFVMYAGKIVEQRPVDDIFYEPGHPYTVGLLRSVPRVDAESHERLIPIEGTPVDTFNPPEGCPFVPRYGHVARTCLQKMPPYVELGEGHRSACWLRVQDQLDKAGQEKPMQDREVSGRE